VRNLDMKSPLIHLADRSQPAVYGVMHIATHGRWREIVAEQLAALRASGLYDRTTRLFISAVGNESPRIAFPDRKIEIIHRSTNLLEYEFPALRRAHQLCQAQECAVYYLHTKGLFRDTPQTWDWRRYMQHFIVERYQDCLDALLEFDVCGVNWTDSPWPHFSGNCWWGRSSYIRELIPPDLACADDAKVDEHRQLCEWWIGSGKGVRPANLHQSHVNHYQIRYPRHLYTGDLPPTQSPAAPRTAKDWSHLRVAVIFDNVVRPDTTGVYCLRALQKLTRAKHFLPSQLDEIPARTFDLFLAIDDGLDYVIPRRLRPSVLWAIDTHLDPARILRRARGMDAVFSAQQAGVDFLRSRNVNCAGWLPLACDPEIHRKLDLEKQFDVCFVAHLNTPERLDLAEQIRRHFPRSFVGQKYFEEMAQTYSASQIALNLNVAGDLNMRVFEVMSCGAMLLTNTSENDGLKLHFKAGEHLDTYSDWLELVAKIKYYLSNPLQRQRIADAGRQESLQRHTYEQRMASILRATEPLTTGNSPHHAESVVVTTASPFGKTSILIPVFNQLECTRRCLESVHRHTHVPHEIVVIDNGSTDGTSEYLASQSDIKVIRNGENKGFSAAINQGIAASTGDHLVLLNNDTVATPNWLDRMLAVLCADARIGLVGPLTNHNPGPQQIAVDYQLPGDADQFAEQLARKNAGRFQECPLLGGFCLLVRRQLVEQIGGLSEEFGIGTFDDFEYSHRAAKAGYRLAIALDSFIHHDGAVTLQSMGIDVPALLKKNELLFRSKVDGDQPADQPIDVTRLPRLVSIVIVTHNCLRYTNLCLDSLRRCTDVPHEIIVVDNGSSDGTPDDLAAMPDVKLIKNETNRGYPAAANQGIQASRGDYVVLLNNDVIVGPGWLARLSGVFASHPEVGITGPISNRVSGPQQIAIGDMLVSDIDRWALEVARVNDRKCEITPRLVGFCMMINRQVIERIGVLDERFGLGNFEDDDFCRRARAAGFQCAIARDCFVYHFGSASFRESGVDYQSLLRKNQLIYQSKWNEIAPTGNVAASEVVSAAQVPARAPSKLSLCMIVRNSSRTLRPCLQSIRPWVDEMIVVDTGSTDDTPDIARELGAKVYEFPWCDDFAAARNKSLEFATGDWLFWMDSDDTIDQENGRKLRELADRAHPAHIMGFVMQVRCPDGRGGGAYATDTAVDHIKLVRNLPGIHFCRRIHEQVLTSIRLLGGDVEWTDIYVTHSGSDSTLEGRRRKQTRDFRILKLELKDDPDDTFTLFNLGMTLLDMGRPSQAISFLCRSLQMAASGESHIRKIYAMLIQCYAELGRPETARRTCFQGLAVCPGDPEILFRKGIVEQSLGFLNDAEKSFLAVLQSQEDRHFSSLDQGIFGIKVWHNLALIYSQQGRQDLEIPAWRRALEFNRDNRTAWRGLLQALRTVRDTAGLKQVAVGEIETTPAEVAALAQAYLLSTEGALQELEDHLEAELSTSKSSELLHDLNEVAFRHELMHVAEKGLRLLIQQSPDDSSAWQNLAQVCMTLQKDREAIKCARRVLQLRPGYAPALRLLETLNRTGLVAVETE
jgi:GT2 family glycosyltransferase/tetratricopeptide (TPR) repeat protein